MMAFDLLKDKKNWCYAAIGLNCLKEGLESYVENEISNLQKAFLKEIGTTHGLDTTTKCPEISCDEIRVKIVDQHRYTQRDHNGRAKNQNAPCWKNTDVTQWCSSPWEIAKCFMTHGYAGKMSAKETDCTGILSVLINCLSLQNSLTTRIDPPNDIISKMRDTRNKLMHSSNLDVTDAELKQYIDDMIAILNGSKTTQNPQDAEKAKTKLNQISQGISIASKEEIIQLERYLQKSWPNKNAMQAPVVVECCDSQPEPVKNCLTNSKVYSLKKETRGTCSIVSNYVFTCYDDHVQTRHGNRADVRGLRTLFDQLHFTVVIWDNLSAQKLREVLEQESDNITSQDECFVCIICSLGTDEGICGTDGYSVHMDEITTYFDGEHCPALVDKPKLFFIQGARGGEKGKPSASRTDSIQDTSNAADALLTSQSETKEIGKPSASRTDSIQDTGNAADALLTSQSETNRIPGKSRALNWMESKQDTSNAAYTLPTSQSETSMPGNLIPSKSDIVVAYSTQPGHVSLRNTEYGSWFIQAVIYVFQTYAWKDHLLDMLTEVNYLVAQQSVALDGEIIKQAPTTQTSLRKRLYFFPGVSDS